MATFATNILSRQVLDWILRSERFVQLAIFTVPPTEAGDDGAEVTGGGYQRADLTMAAPTDQTGAKTGQASSTGSLLFSDMPVASDMVNGLAVVDGDTGDVLIVNDSWTPASPFDVGGNLLVDLATVFVGKASA